jgi:hypothetical protein
LASAEALAEYLLTQEHVDLPKWMASAASLYVYGFAENEPCQTLLQKLTGDANAKIVNLHAACVKARVSDRFPDLCGPMSGIEAHLQEGAADCAFRLQPSDHLKSIVECGAGSLFAETRKMGNPVFLDASKSVIDIHRPASLFFDVRKSFAGAVPLVMFVRWAFRGLSSAPYETSACLTIDDPPLKRRYGFLVFQELLQLMEKHTFAASIAFIPWNWRRTHRGTISAFQNNSQKISVCVHGCDHTGGEFAVRSRAALDRISKTAASRMASFRRRTGLNYDQVMVFPQGAFSPEAAQALKQNGFVAAVNTEVAPVGDGLNQTTIADLWSVAILRYGQFPIFTRRYVHHGIENFAFDGLLGKPCFVVGHHDLLRDHGAGLAAFVEALNSLRWNLRWRTVGSAVARSCCLLPCNGNLTLQMLAEYAIFENRDSARRTVLVRKPEAEVDLVESVTVNGERADFSYVHGAVQFCVHVPAGQTVEIHCNYRKTLTPCEIVEPVSRRIRVAAQRYLSEFRDNYIARNDSLLRAVTVARRLLR